MNSACTAYASGVQPRQGADAAHLEQDEDAARESAPRVAAPERRQTTRVTVVICHLRAHLIINVGYDS
jgi:hypothetical protein